MRYLSHAKWPLKVYKGIYGNGVSTDIHGTREEAEAVCGLLESDGFGGLGQSFPIKTWIDEGPNNKQEDK